MLKIIQSALLQPRLLALLALQILALLPLQTHAQMCVPNSENIIQLSATYAPRVREQVRKEFVAIAADLIKLGGEVTFAERAVVTATNINFAKISASSQTLQAQTKALKNRLQKAVNSLTHSEATMGRETLAVYFKVVSSLTNVVAMTQPMNIALQNFKAAYAVSLSSRARNSMYPTNYEMPDGTEMATISAQPLTYRIALSSNVIFEAIVRATATSKLMEKMSRAHLETSRCALSRLILAKYQVHRIVVGEKLDALPVGGQERICSNTPVRDFNDFVMREADEAGEIMVREQIAEKLPNAIRDISPEALGAIAASENLANNLLNLYVYPELVSVDAEGTNPAVLAMVNASIEKSIAANDKKNPAFATLKHLWRSNGMRAVAQKIYSNLAGCRYEAKNEFYTDVTMNEMLAKFSRSEDIMFTSMLESEIAMASISFSRQTPDRLASVIKNYIIDMKVRSLKQAALSFLYRTSSDFSLDRESFVAALDKDIESAARAEINARWPSSGLEAVVNNIANQIQGQKSSGSRFELKAYMLSKTMHEKALDIEKIMNPQTPVEKLGFNRPALVRIFSGEIQSLSGPNRMRMNYALGENNPAVKLKIWRDLDARVKAQIKKHGVQCGRESMGRSIYRSARDFFGSIVGKTPVTEADAAQRDCGTVTRLGNNLALNRLQDPKDISHVIKALKPIASNKELNEFTQNYREEVASDILSEYRLLDAPLDEKNKKSKLLYQELARQISQNQGRISDQLVQNNIPLIKSLIKRSLPTLEKELFDVIRARKSEDLAFFITRTKVINRLLGEDEDGHNNPDFIGSFNYSATLPDSSDKATFNSTQLITGPGLHFPELLKFHQQLQHNMLKKEDYSFNSLSEFLSFQGQISMAVLGGWAAKWAFGYVPKFAGGPFVSSAFQRLGSRASRLIGGHSLLVTPIFLGSIGVFEYQKRNYNSSLNNVNDLMRSDALKFGGVTSTMPLIEWSDYRQQKILFTNTIKQLKSAQLQTAGFLALSVGLSFAPRLTNLTRPMNFLNKKALQSSAVGGKLSKALETHLRFQIWAIKNQQSRNLAILGNPKSIDIATLIQARDIALAKTGSGLIGRLKANRINNAYENIIGNIGQRVWKYEKQPHLQEVLNRAMFGSRGDASQVSRWIAEYKRLYPVGT